MRGDAAVMVEKVIERKQQLQTEINEALVRFNQDTGLFVEGIDTPLVEVTPMYSSSASQYIQGGVHVRVVLP